MLKQMRFWLSFLLLILIVGCGGGTSIATSDADSDDSDSDDTTTETYALEVSLVDESGTAISTVSAASPGYVQALLTLDGTPVSGEVVSFSSSLGSLTPSLGTALTDDSGIAEITLSAGSEQGAGTVTASYDDISDSLGFYTEGDELTDTEVSIEVSTQLYYCSGDESPPADTCVETDNISQLEPGTLLINVMVEGTTTPVEGTLVTVSTDYGELSPSSGSALTDESGNAYIGILAGSDYGEFVTYTVTVEDVTDTGYFTIGAVDEDSIDIQVTDSLGGATLPAGGSTVIQVEVFQEDGVTPYSESLSIEFSSSCSDAGTAIIDSPVNTVNGVGNTTYTAAGCVGTDLVSITVGSYSVTHEIDVAASSVGSIEFVSVSESYIAIQQAGGLASPTTSVVTFLLLDENDNPVANAEIDFTLNTGNGGVSLDPAVGYTNSEGYVSTTVTSGTVPTPVRITASYSEDGEILVSQVSDGITISTGLADNNSFSLAVETFNVEALATDGIEVEVTAYAADHFNNPVPDGSTIQFTAEGGAIGSSCSTVDGVCSVTWRSQNPRPLASGDPRFDSSFDFVNTIVDAGCGAGTFYSYGPCLEGEISETGTAFAGPQGGRSTLLAYMLGEESFADANNNGLFDDGEFFVPLDDAYVDHNRNGVFDGDSAAASAATDGMDLDGGELEEFYDNPIPDAQDGAYSDVNDPSYYQGTLCSDDAEALGHCSVNAVHARQNNIIVMSGSTAYFRVLEGLSPIEDSDGELDVTTGTDSATIYISDLYNNPMPSGSTITVSAVDVELLTDSSYTYPNTTEFWGFGLAVKSPDDPEGDGYITITVTTPLGVSTQIGINVNVID